jgi:hypothetical protein
MILSEVRDYLRKKQRVPLNDLVIHFHTDAGALRGMLDKWIAKGKVRRTQSEAQCGTGCCKCDPLLTEIYEWVDE